MLAFMTEIVALISTLQPLATLGAALVAAGAALLTLFVTGRSARHAEMRVSQREVIQPYLQPLSAAVHECIALSFTVRRTSVKNKPAEGWISKAREASETMKTLRTELRYVLPGLDNGLRVLSLLPHWAIHVRDLESDRPERMLEAAGKLVAAIDDCVLRVSTKGLQPSRRHIRRVVSSADLVKKIFDEGADSPTNLLASVVD